MYIYVDTMLNQNKHNQQMSKKKENEEIEKVIKEI